MWLDSLENGNSSVPRLMIGVRAVLQQNPGHIHSGTLMLCGMMQCGISYDILNVRRGPTGQQKLEQLDMFHLGGSAHYPLGTKDDERNVTKVVRGFCTREVWSSSIRNCLQESSNNALQLVGDVPLTSWTACSCPV